MESMNRTSEREGVDLPAGRTWATDRSDRAEEFYRGKIGRSSRAAGRVELHPRVCLALFVAQRAARHRHP